MQTVGIDQLVGRPLGEYEVEQRLGRGELSTVYIAHQSALGRKVMIIMFNPPEGISALEQQRFTVRFAQEGAALRKLKHPNILPTYDFGELSGHPYLVTALVKGVSLNQLLKQQGRFTLQQTLAILKQIASALDYAHSSGVVHGLLSISNILINQDSKAQIINFGTKTVFDTHRHIQNEQPVDTRSDIYVLGVILFELLSGSSPFGAGSPSNVALTGLRQPIPSIHAKCPDIPETFDVVINKTLEQDPARGYQYASDIAVAFEHALQVGEAFSGVNSSTMQQLLQDPQLTLPPTVNWFDEASIFPAKTESPSPLPTGHIPTVTSSFSVPSSENPTEMLPRKDGGLSPAGSNSGAIGGVDPLDWWSVTEGKPDTSQPLAGTFAKRPSVGFASSRPYSSRRPVQLNRRKVFAVIAAGTVTVSALVLGINLTQHTQHSPAQVANGPINGSNTANTTYANQKGSTPGAQSTKGTQNTATSSNTPTSQPSPTQAGQPGQPQPTTQPAAPPPPPPSHTGTVIGSTSQAVNSAQGFTNPADGQAALLIHLSNGSFAATETACTHQGVPVNYSGGKLVCPAHGAIFDPASGNYLSGFGRQLSPLPTVAIRANADGTITTG